ncbi:MAG: nickel transporter, partial [Methylacidiphilales bacterium]|nr:nickel transporter [Candidatus Methylacidiphilales bacterium]
MLGVVAVLALPALAQSGPFGVGPKPPPAPADGVLGWIMSVQAEFYRSLTQALRAARTDHAAAGGLVSLSLAYGVFHAAGPGHGKAVISAYLLANEATWRRGMVLAFASAMVQAVVAVALVAITATLVRTTAAQMGATVRAIEIASYAG